MASNVRNQSEKIKFADSHIAPLSQIHTGGNAEFLSRPSTLDQLEAVVSFAQREGLDLTVLGGLSNSLVSDSGIDGVAIHTACLNEMHTQGNLLIAQCGASMDELIDYAIENGLGGLERLGGLPGTVGGAVYGNSGAHGLYTAHHLYWVDYLDEEANLVRLRAHRESFSYRHSPFWGRSNMIIYEVAFLLEPIVHTNEARQQKEQFKGQRRAKGQYLHPSIGCIFRNPDGQSAGQIIDALGLKGTSIGGAMIAPGHANFIINTEGTATSADVKALIDLVKETVAEKTGIMLEEEIRYLGAW
ncbi:MAG: UDP-N-acetylmuramate dehydrogenase [Sphaerochaeta sp.]|jgi:UDP-N-acetylmuramate dehydrogenase|nr:UDP-N-acetylmuramate dehydrogenase [Sphaerochaeta sp.]MDX9915462.1 UDP-N-acetylmuramate dehydrogenase [Sphaerochaeta sp.]